MFDVKKFALSNNNLLEEINSKSNSVIFKLSDKLEKINKLAYGLFMNQGKLASFAGNLSNNLSAYDLSQYVDLLNKETQNKNTVDGMKEFFFCTQEILKNIKNYYDVVSAIELYKDVSTKNNGITSLLDKYIKIKNLIIENDKYISLKFTYNFVKKELYKSLGEFEKQVRLLTSKNSGITSIVHAILKVDGMDMTKEKDRMRQILSFIAQVNDSLEKAVAELGVNDIAREGILLLDNVIKTYEYAQLKFDPTFVGSFDAIVDLDDLHKKYNNIMFALKSEEENLNRKEAFVKDTEKTNQMAKVSNFINRHLANSKFENKAIQLVDVGNQILRTKETIINDGNMVSTCAIGDIKLMEKCLDDKKRLDRLSISELTNLSDYLVKKQAFSSNKEYYTAIILKIQQYLKEIAENKSFKMAKLQTKIGDSTVKDLNKKMDLLQDKINNTKKELDKAMSKYNKTSTKLVGDVSIGDIESSVSIKEAKKITKDDMKNLIGNTLNSYTNTQVKEVIGKKDVPNYDQGDYNKLKGNYKNDFEFTDVVKKYMTIDGNGMKGGEIEGSVPTSDKALFQQLSESFKDIDEIHHKSSVITDLINDSYKEKLYKISSNRNISKSEKLEQLRNLRIGVDKMTKDIKNGVYMTLIQDFNEKKQNVEVKTMLLTYISQISSFIEASNILMYNITKNLMIKLFINIKITPQYLFGDKFIQNYFGLIEAKEWLTRYYYAYISRSETDTDLEKQKVQDLLAKCIVAMDRREYVLVNEGTKESQLLKNKVESKTSNPEYEIYAGARLTLIREMILERTAPTAFYDIVQQSFTKPSSINRIGGKFYFNHITEDVPTIEVPKSKVSGNVNTFNGFTQTMMNLLEANNVLSNFALSMFKGIQDKETPNWLYAYPTIGKYPPKLINMTDVGGQIDNKSIDQLTEWTNTKMKYYTLKTEIEANETFLDSHIKIVSDILTIIKYVMIIEPGNTTKAEYPKYKSEYPESSTFAYQISQKKEEIPYEEVKPTEEKTTGFNQTNTPITQKQMEEIAKTFEEPKPKEEVAKTFEEPKPKEEEQKQVVAVKQPFNQAPVEEKASMDTVNLGDLFN